MESIGQRAAKEIMRRVKYGNVNFEMERMKIPLNNFYGWANGSRNPSANFLRQMALAGYDVYYILTGEKSGKP